MTAMATLLVAQLLAPTPVPTAAPASGYGPWHLGMSREQVTAVSVFGPYSPVQVTGGLETKNGAFADKKTTVSFVFGDRGLRLIQVWAYEGRNAEEAVAAFYRVYRHLEKDHGAVETGLRDVPANADSVQFSGPVRRFLSAVPPGRAAKVQLAPVEKSSSIRIFSSLMTQPQLGYYYVFLYYVTPEPPR